MSGLDNYGYFGPNFSFADSVPLPGQVGVRQDSSISALVDSAAAVNTYLDIIAFGAPTFFDQQQVQPMGIRYYMDTGMRCSNGANMSQYFDTVPKGTALGSTIAAGLASAGLPPLKGLAPGMVESAESALDPRPIFAAVSGTGYPVCQQVQCPVGTPTGSIANQSGGGGNFIIDPVQYVNGMPTQTRWVQAYDSTGAGITISKGEFAATPKCYNPDGSYMTRPPNGCPAAAPPGISQAGVLPYDLCTVLQPATLPPTLNPEGFANMDTGRMGAAVAVAVLGGVALWALGRRR